MIKSADLELAVPRHHTHALKVGIHVGMSLGRRIQQSANRGHQSTQALNVLLPRVFHLHATSLVSHLFHLHRDNNTCCNLVIEKELPHFMFLGITVC